MPFGLIDKSLEGRQKVFFPHWSRGLVPVDRESNLAFRRRMYAVTNKQERALLRRYAREDLLFYLSGFVYIFDAGDDSGEPGPVPFLPHEFQVEALTCLFDCVNGGKRRPVRMKKPRHMGATWMVVSVLEHCWHWFPNRHILVGSRREEEVDGSIVLSKGDRFSGEWSKLLPKFDFIHLHQPSWMWPEGYSPRVEPYRARMKLVNPANGSMVWGTSATGKAGRQERGWVAFWDEAAHTDNLFEIIGGLSRFSPCKIWVSSIGNLDHAFSTVLKDAAGVQQLNLEWWMHPVYSRDMRVNEETGDRTSPWLAEKLDEINHDPIIANQEYFADESKQVGGFYHPDVFQVMLGTSDRPGTVREPLYQGALDIHDSERGPFVSRFVEQPSGRWRFWTEFGPNGSPPRATKYVMGCDIAAGTSDADGRGASNSVLVVVDRRTGEVVAEYVTHGMRPDRLARVAAAAGRWFEGEDFRPCLINAERNGPGATFLDDLVTKYGYSDVWRAEDEQLGWFKGKNARVMFSAHQRMICEGLLVERGRDCADEMRHYQNPTTSGGAPIHAAALHSKDPSGARENHGDRTIARVVACVVMDARPYEPTVESASAPWGSYRAIKEAREDREYDAQLA